MSPEPCFLKKRGRPKKQSIADRIRDAQSKKRLQNEKDQPLSDWDIMAIASRLTRKR